jgi:hypothetical protein
MYVTIFEVKKCISPTLTLARWDDVFDDDLINTTMPGNERRSRRDSSSRQDCLISVCSYRSDVEGFKQAFLRYLCTFELHTSR